MHPAIRSQVDNDFDLYSVGASITFDPAEDTARQEFKAEADINVLMARFGMTAPQRQTMFGEVDFGLDLQTAYAAIDAARRMHAKLPRNLTERYPDWQSVLNALNSGELRLDLEASADDPVPVVPTPAPAGDKPAESK